MTVAGTPAVAPTATLWGSTAFVFSLQVPYMTIPTFCYTSPPINPYWKSTRQHLQTQPPSASTSCGWQGRRRPGNRAGPAAAPRLPPTWGGRQWGPRARRVLLPGGSSLGRENSSLTKGPPLFFFPPFSPLLIFCCLHDVIKIKRLSKESEKAEQKSAHPENY